MSKEHGTPPDLELMKELDEAEESDEGRSPPQEQAGRGEVRRPGDGVLGIDRVAGRNRASRRASPGGRTYPGIQAIAQEPQSG